MRGTTLLFRDDIEETFKVLDKDGDGILGREGIIHCRGKSGLNTIFVKPDFRLKPSLV